MKGAYKFFHRLLSAPFRFIFRIKISGRENEPGVESGAFLICANHMSGWDAIWLGAALRYKQIHFMSKAELFKIPLLGRLLHSLGAYPVNRRIADVSSVRKTIALLESDECVCMFPQGTRHPGKNPLNTEVKSGAGMIAYRAGVSVLPVFIKTKKFNSSAFSKKEIIIGKMIDGTKFKKLHDEGADYKRISRYIFEVVCGLDGETSVADS